MKIAFCGVDCGSCVDYKDGKCPGCRESVWPEGDECMPVACCREKNISCCGQCQSFPCEDMKAFYGESESHRDAYERMRGEVRLNNILLPLWLLIFWPSYLWLILIPANYFVDRIVLRWSLGNMEGKGLFCRKHTWKICLAGFFSDFVGMLILFGVFMATALAEDALAVKNLLDTLGEGVGFNPFNSIWSFLVVLCSVAAAGLLIFLIDRRILTKAGLNREQAQKSAIRLALITAPYLYFFPSMLLYQGGLLG